LEATENVATEVADRLTDSQAAEVVTRLLLAGALAATNIERASFDIPMSSGTHGKTGDDGRSREMHDD